MGEPVHEGGALGPARGVGVQPGDRQGAGQQRHTGGELDEGVQFHGPGPTWLLGW
ncbi:hypothetical protein ACQ4WX_30715 [Streptomyces lasalocidi]